MPALEDKPARNHDELPEGVAQEIDWSDYRDHLSTADQEGHRRWLYPKKPKGDFYRWRTWMSWLLLAISMVLRSTIFTRSASAKSESAAPASGNA